MYPRNDDSAVTLSKEETFMDRMYLKMESICVEADKNLIQGASKYVETQVSNVSSNVKKICADFIRELLPPPEEEVLNECRHVEKCKCKSEHQHCNAGTQPNSQVAQGGDSKAVAVAQAGDSKAVAVAQGGDLNATGDAQFGDSKSAHAQAEQIQPTNAPATDAQDKVADAQIGETQSADAQVVHNDEIVHEEVTGATQGVAGATDHVLASAAFSGTKLVGKGLVKGSSSSSETLAAECDTIVEEGDQVAKWYESDEEMRLRFFEAEDSEKGKSSSGSSDSESDSWVIL